MNKHTTNTQRTTKRFDWELLDDGKGGKWSRCLDQLWRGAERSGSSQVNFVPTHHWLPPHKGGGGGSGVGQYCLMAGRTGKHTCYAWSDALIKEFTNSMRVCFAEALRLGLTIGVRPHLVRRVLVRMRGAQRRRRCCVCRCRVSMRGRGLKEQRHRQTNRASNPFLHPPPHTHTLRQDDGTGNGAWRNGLLFRPADKYAGFSYYGAHGAVLCCARCAYAVRAAVRAAVHALGAPRFGGGGMRFPR